MTDRVLLTGASRGIGRATAERLAGEGVPLVLWARDQTALEEARAVCERAGGDALIQRVDVRDAAQVRAAVTRLGAEHQGLRAVVVNAGVGEWHPLLRYPDELWDDTLATNLRGAHLTLTHTLPLLLSARSPQLIAVGSDSGLTGLPGRAAYCASKWGLRGLLEVAREEHRSDGLRCTHLAVGAVDTGFRSGTPGGRPGALDPADVGDVIAWLLALPPHVELRELHAASMALPFGSPANHPEGRK
ncbi:SDR family oxidoreductase [Streptomyces sp. NPDC058964]|uniref:SDR family oxidoreductase n=1 Tax=Streptomyces sp. NPDC058964 TaxID=3346681 RepID=UPI0036ADDD73